MPKPAPADTPQDGARVHSHDGAAAHSHHDDGAHFHSTNGDAPVHSANGSQPLHSANGGQPLHSGSGSQPVHSRDGALPHVHSSTEGPAPLAQRKQRGPVASYVERVAPPFLFAVVVVLLWAWASASRPDSVLPSPALVARTIADVAASGELGRVAFASLRVMAIGFTVSAVAGIGFGLLIASVRTVDRAVSPYLIGLQSLPSAVWIPFAIVFFGAARSAVLAVTILGALPSIAIGTRDAVHGVPPILVRAARTLGARGPSLLFRVVVPAAMPGIVSGLEHGWAFSFRSLVAGELITGVDSVGFGRFLTDARTDGRVDRMLAAVLVIMLVGVAVDRLGFARAQRRLRARRGLGTVTS